MQRRNSGLFKPQTQIELGKYAKSVLKTIHNYMQSIETQDPSFYNETRQVMRGGVEKEVRPKFGSASNWDSAASLLRRIRRSIATNPADMQLLSAVRELIKGCEIDALQRQIAKGMCEFLELPEGQIDREVAAAQVDNVRTQMAMRSLFPISSADRVATSIRLGYVDERLANQEMKSVNEFGSVSK